MPSFYEFPRLVAPFSAREYFWHKLPYAAPGFVTFFIGAFLAALSLLAWRARRERRPALLALALTCVGYGTLGLMLALRAVVLDRALLLRIHDVGYGPVLLLSPGTLMLAAAFTSRHRRLTRVVLAVLWATTALGLVGLARGCAFTAEGTAFAFGFYPRSTPWLAPWGLASAVVLPLHLALVVAARREGNLTSRALALGLVLLPIVTLTNLPALLGVPLFPGANFTFVPLLLVAWGIFHIDFLSLNALLFERSGLFYFLCGAVCFAFALLAFGVATGLSPAHYGRLSSLVWPVIPLVSALVVFSLGIFVAGSNPTERLNQLAGAMLFILGFYVVQGINRTLDVEPIISLRIDQLCYLAFALAPAIQPRVALAAVGLPTPRWMHLLDAGAVLCSALALTPFMFRGYFVYEFGRVPASGPGLTLFSAIGAGGTVAGLLAATTAKGATRTPRSSLVVAACFVGGLLLVLSIPATRGVPFYSFGHLQLVPAALFAFAVLRFGAVPVQEEIGRVSARLTLLSLTILPLVALLLFCLLPADQPLRFRLLHLALLLSPVFLVTFALLFVLSRPIAERLQREKQRTEQILLAILPKDVVDELKTHGRVAPRGHESVTILFVDFVGFTRFAASSEPAVVVAELDRHFARFDAIAARYGLDKLKTIGDAYMAAAGLSRENRTHPIDACLAALALQREIDALNAEARSAGRPVWPARIGLHTGPVISGVLGAGKLAFDIWGDAVNVAARMESASEAGFINLSETTAREVEPFFLLQDRGRISVKNRGRLSMFFLLGLRPELTGLEPGAPNELFRRRYDERLRWSTRTPSARPLPPSVEDGDGSVTPPAEAG